MAKGEGFEPPDGCPSVVFKTTALSRSATPPLAPEAGVCLPLEALWRLPKAGHQVNASEGLTGLARGACLLLQFSALFVEI